MVAKTILIATIIAYVEARFGQEQVPIQAISAVQGGAPGAAATIAGAAISDLLGAANACAKLVRADQIVSELGGGQDAIDAAIGMVAAEKNTNPFQNNNVQNVCNDPTLPATAELRGITPLIDPAVDVNGAVAALSEQTKATPLNADGLSVFDLLVNQGLGDLVAGQAADGAAAGGAAAGGNAANGNASDNNNQNANNNQNGNGNANDNNNQNANNNQNGNGNANDNNKDAAADDCEDAGNANDNQQGAAGNATGNGNEEAAADDCEDAGNANDNQQGAAGNATDNANDANGNGNAAAGGNAAGAGQQAAGLAGADFGLCQPTIIFEGGQNGRPADEFTFQIADPLARGGQQEALNPNIITNALCNQLTNVCEANDAAISACEDAKAQVQAAGTRDKSTADLFNSALGFAGFVTNPDGGPENPPAAANRMMRRGLRMRV